MEYEDEDNDGVEFEPVVEMFVDVNSKGGYAYTLQLGNEFVRCEDVNYLEEDAAGLAEAFELWRRAAEAGEAGYTYWTE